MSIIINSQNHYIYHVRTLSLPRLRRRAAQDGRVWSAQSAEFPMARDMFDDDDDDDDESV